MTEHLNLNRLFPRNASSDHAEDKQEPLLLAVLQEYAKDICDDGGWFTAPALLASGFRWRGWNKNNIAEKLREMASANDGVEWNGGQTKGSAFRILHPEDTKQEENESGRCALYYDCNIGGRLEGSHTNKLARDLLWAVRDAIQGVLGKNIRIELNAEVTKEDLSKVWFSIKPSFEEVEDAWVADPDI